jgi:pimeloyl-ACP methyl ester carboxylesterase
MHEKRVGVGKVDLAYRIAGDGPRAVLAVHGWMMAGGVWDDLVEAIDLSGLTLVVADLRGAGASGKPGSGFSLERHAKDLWALSDTLGLQQPALIGHSMGGQITQMMAVMRPADVSTLILLNSVPASGLPLPEDAVGLFRTSAGDRDKQGAILDMACLQLSPDARERLLDMAGALSEPCIVQSFDAWTAGGFQDQLGQITATTHAVATSDPFLPPDFVQQAVVDPIARAQLHVLEGPGHYPQVEAPGRTATLIQSLLGEAPPMARATPA